MKRLIAAGIAALLVVVGLLGWRAVASGPQTEFTATFESAVGLYPGSEVQMLGVAVGEVTEVKPSKNGVNVTMKLDSGQAAAQSTDAIIVAPTLVSDRFVQLTEPHTTGPKLADGATLSGDRTAIPVEIDDLYNSLTDMTTALGPQGANNTGALSDLLDVAARNLDGQGTEINQLFDDFGQASGTLADSGDDLFATVSNLKEFNDMLVANDSSVASVNTQLAAVSDSLADDSDDMAAAIANLADALAIVDDFVKNNRTNLRTSVEKLQGPTRVLVNQKKSLEESVRLVPLILQNFVRAYNPNGRWIEGRGNLNEASIWANRARAGSPAPLLPEANQ